jgi:hypothetical protein
MTLLLAMATDETNETMLGHWQDTSAQLMLLKNSHKLAKPVSESFSAKIQRRLASTVPPKPMVELSFEDAFEKLTQMSKDCQEAVRIVDFGPENIQRLKVCYQLYLMLHNILIITIRHSYGHSVHGNLNPCLMPELASQHPFLDAMSRASEPSFKKILKRLSCHSIQF